MIVAKQRSGSINALNIGNTVSVIWLMTSLGFCPTCAETFSGKTSE